MSWLYFAESFLIALLAKACTGAPGVLASAGWTWLSIRQSSVRNAGGGSAMISNSFGEEFGWQATKFSARNPTGRLNNFRRVPPRGALPNENLSLRPSSTKPCFRRGPRRGALLERGGWPTFGRETWGVMQSPLQKVGQTSLSRRAPLRGPLRKQGLVELGLKERFSCFAASQAAQRNSPRLLAEILTFGRAPRGGTRQKLLSLPVGFLAENFVACQPNSSPKDC